MGHKINPDIYRLGVSKTWSFQLRTNKNFLKNLFLFKFLRNLFMNYTIPFFNFKKRRNHKINEKLILRGEDQIVSSPFVKNNILFSHTYFGLLKDKLYIESFFIDVAFKQVKRKYDNPRKRHSYDIVEFKPWSSFFYKTVYLRNLSKLKFKSQSNLKRLFGNRIFKFINRHSRVIKIKPIKIISKNFFSLYKNIGSRYQKEYYRYISNRFRIFYRKIISKKKKRNPIVFAIKLIPKPKRRKYKFKYKFKFWRLIKKRLRARRRKIKRENIRLSKLFFRINKRNRTYKRIRRRFALRRLKKRKSYNFPIKSLKYIYRNRLKNYKQITLPKLFRLISKSYYSSFESLNLKRGLPKNPLFLYDYSIQNEKKFLFYKNYSNLKLLKYFVRVLKFVSFFSLKKKIFFFQNLLRLLMNFFGLTNSTILTKKMYLLFQILMFHSSSYSFFNFLNLKKNYFTRFIFYKSVSKSIHRNMIELANNKKLSMSFIGQNKFRFNSSLVLNYILIKLGQYFTIHDIVNPLSFYIKNLTSIAGYKILITGRLTRKERAAVMIRSGKRMPLSTIKANIDYSAGFKIMKFGLVGIKVYLLMSPSMIINLYRFKYSYD